MNILSGVSFKVLGLSLAIATLTAGVFSAGVAAQQTGGTQQDQALASTNELAQRHYRRANTYNNMERFDEAVTEYQLAIAADPNMSDAYRNLANIFLSREQFNDAITMLARFITLQNNQPGTPLIASLKTIGELLRRAERFDESIDYDIRAIAADPRDESQIHLMANRYDNAGDAEKAIRIYEQATISIPDNAFMNRNLGRLLEREGRLQEALVQYQRAAETDPSAQYYRELVQNIEARLALSATVAQG